MRKIFTLLLFLVFCFVATTTNIVGSNTVTSQVNFHFDGLQVLAFGDSNRVSLGIMDVPHHTPEIKIVRVEKGRAVSLAIITAKELRNQEVTLDVPNKKLQPTRHYSPDMNKDKQDFRWCLDLENDLFQKQLHLKDQFFTKIRFNTGTFFAGELSKEQYQFTNGSRLHGFKRAIANPAAQISMIEGENVLISYGKERLSLPAKAGVNYSIDITNLPRPDYAANHFFHYYDLLKTDVVRYEPVKATKIAYAPYPVFCNSVVLSRSRIN